MRPGPHVMTATRPTPAVFAAATVCRMICGMSGRPLKAFSRPERSLSRAPVTYTSGWNRKALSDETSVSSPDSASRVFALDVTTVGM